MVDLLVGMALKALESRELTWLDVLGVGVACPGQITRWVNNVLYSTHPPVYE